MNESEIIEIIEESMYLEKGRIGASDVLRNMHEWDSIATIMFMSEIEGRYGTTIDPQKLAKCVKVSDLVSLVGESVTAAKTKSNIS